MTWTGQLPETTLRPLSSDEMREFRGTLEDTPANSEALAALASGHARAFVAGNAQAPRAGIIDNCWDQNEPMAIGTDAESIWSLLSRYSGWTCVGGLTRPTAEALAAIIRRQLGLEPRFKAAILFDLKRPAIPHESRLVRLLDPRDASLVERAPAEMLGLYRGGSELLDRAVVAAGVRDGEIVGWMSSGEWTPRHAGVGGHVLEPWRNQGVGSAAAFLVAQAAQRAGRTPTWSTGEDNPRSQHVAQKLGFEECGRDWYVILPALWGSGGYRP